MKLERCPECGTPRECKVWQHCHCGYNFEPDYVYVRQPAPLAERPVEVAERAPLSKTWLVILTLIVAGGITGSLITNGFAVTAKLVVKVLLTPHFWFR